MKYKSKKLKIKGGKKEGKRTRRNKNKDFFMKLSCSPKNNNIKPGNFTCYSKEDINKLKEMWNARHPDMRLLTNDTTKIWNILKKYYSNICNKESCWIRQMTKNTKMEKELLEAFAPKSPEEWKKNPNEWLSSIDILKVMNQYEKKYKCFEFMGPSPIDYDTQQLNNECVWDELCNFDLNEQIKKGKTKIGVIFNLDPHYKSGSHWVSLFINIKKKYVYYFDSTGEKIPLQIKKFADNVIEQGNKLSIKFIFDQNYPVEHQYGNTECGIYSLFFIVHMLEDKITGNYLKTHILKDKYIEKFRKIYFNGDL